MNTFVKLTCLLIVSSIVSGCGVKDISINQEILDFGEKEEGIEFEIVFPVNNTGTAPVKITDVKPTCTCVFVKDWDKEIAPKKSGNITLTFKTTALKGEVTRNVEVFTDVPGKKKILLSMHGIIKDPFFTILPRFNFIGEVKYDTKELQGLFTIANNLDTPLKIIKINPPEDLKTRYKLTTVQENKKYQFDFTILPPFTGKDQVQKSFTLTTNNENKPSIDLVFSYRVLPPIEVFPKVLFIDPKQTLNTNFVAKVFIRNNSALPIEVTDFSIENGDGFLAQTSAILENISYKIDITLPENYQFNPGRKTIISFRVKNDPDQTLYSIPIEAKAADSSGGN